MLHPQQVPQIARHFSRENLAIFCSTLLITIRTSLVMNLSILVGQFALSFFEAGLFVHQQMAACCFFRDQKPTSTSQTNGENPTRSDKVCNKTSLAMRTLRKHLQFLLISKGQRLRYVGAKVVKNILPRCFFPRISEPLSGTRWARDPVKNGVILNHLVVGMIGLFILYVLGSRPLIFRIGHPTCKKNTGILVMGTPKSLLLLV